MQVKRSSAVSCLTVPIQSFELERVDLDDSETTEAVRTFSPQTFKSSIDSIV